MDGLSDDGRFGITIIAFIGSVFSPYYAWSGRDDPANHCAFNVVLYGRQTPGWAMTERTSKALNQSRHEISIGPSGLSWDGSSLTIHIDETTAPVPTPLRGTVTLQPEGISDTRFHLDTSGRHAWWPIAPCSRIRVAMDKPDLSWTGSGYFDTNAGDEPLESAFVYWTWSRAELPEGAAILYDVQRRDGTDLSLALTISPTGKVDRFEPPEPARLPSTPIWRVPRDTRVDAGHGAEVRRTFEDTPFYSRSEIRSHVKGYPVTAMHESLSLDRLKMPWVRMLLPFRMPRAFW